MFDKYPYSNFHEMNLDWIIQEMKDLIEDWEEFSGRVSAEAHVSETPEVNVTGDLKDGLLFDFGLVQGPRGLTGIQGPQGPKGDTGSGLQILDIYPTLAALQSAHPTGSAGDAYLVGTEGNYVLYIWSETSSAWSNAGTLTTPSPSNSDPSMNGTAAAGSSAQYSRADHVHPSDTSKLNVSNVNGVYAVEEGSQTMIGVSDNSSPDALVRYDSNGAINGTNLNMSGTVSALRLSVMNDQVLNSDKLKALVNGGNAHQVIANNNPIDMIAMGVDAVDNTPTVAFHGVKYDNTGTMTAADAAVGFSTAFTTNYTDYDRGRIDLAPASATQIGGVRIGAGLTVSEGALSNAYVAGDSISVAAAVTSDIIVSGLVTGGAADLWFTIPLDKPILANNVNFTSLKILPRGVNGYLDGSVYTDIATDSRYTVSYSVNRFGIEVRATRNSAYDVTNNTPAALIIRGFDCSFS